MNHGYNWWISPDFNAVRVATYAGGPWRNMTYVEYADPEWPGGNNSYEERLLFDMDDDPFQTRNEYANETYGQELDHLRRVLNALKNCAGETCRDLDGR